MNETNEMGYNLFCSVKKKNQRKFCHLILLCKVPSVTRTKRILEVC